MMLLKKIKNVVAKFRTSEFDRFRYRYANLPRYTPCKIRFRSFIFEALDAASVVWQIKETFFDEHLKFESRSPSPVILDCGANVGVTAIYFKKLFPAADITAFEADPKTAEILKNNLKVNGIAGVSVMATAVWTTPEGIDFSPDGADGGSIYGNTLKIKVPSVRLKEVIDSKSRVDMLKMDIEGAETETLLDCGETLRKVRQLFVEYHSFNSRPQDLDKLLKLLSENNFRYYLENQGRNHSHFVGQNPKEMMDLQVNIYATNQVFEKK